MNLLHPPRLQALAREYALGTMQGGARRRFERLLHDSAAARAALAQWQEHLAPLADAVPPMAPRPQVWEGIAQRLSLAGATPARPAAAPPGPWWQRVFGTRVLGSVLASALVCVVATTALLQANPGWLGHEQALDELPASYVGLLSDAAAQPAVLLSSRRHGRTLVAKMLKPLPPPAGQVAVLWAFPKGGEAPFLVGALPATGSARLALADTSEKLFFKVDRLGVSFEAEGSKAAAPSGPLVVQGPCVKLW
jgi:anti-sigma-K factor RskA